MTTLIFGGNGKTGSQLTKLLHAANHPFLVASRQGVSTVDPSYKTVKFDWDDPNTYENPFKADSNIENLYLCILPTRKNPEVLETARPVLDLAKKAGFSVASVEKRVALILDKFTSILTDWECTISS
jgi:festuclavine dehydrogenase